MEEPDTISVREYLEQMFTRMETSLIAEIQQLQKDVEYIKTHQLHRGEFDAIINNIHREIDRVERQGAERIAEHKKDILERLGVSKDEESERAKRQLTILGICLTIFIFVINIGMSLFLR